MEVPVHAARLSPLQPETVWTLEGDELVERRGARERRLALARITALRTTPRGALLAFGPLVRVAIPGLTYGGGLRPQDNAQSFAPFMAALIESVARKAPKARLLTAGPSSREPIIWAIALSGGGAAALLVFAASSGAWALGLSLAARLAFVAILAGAVLPWLDRPAR